MEAEDVEGAGTSLERIAAVFLMISAVTADEAVEATVPYHWQDGGGYVQAEIFPTFHVNKLPLFVIEQVLPTYVISAGMVSVTMTLLSVAPNE
jgi:hypothetical protein